MKEDLERARSHDLLLTTSCVHLVATTIRGIGITNEGQAQWTTAILIASKLGDGGLSVLGAIKFDHARTTGASVRLVLDLGLLDRTNGGEEIDEIVSVFEDLSRVGVSILNIGQYLRPSLSHTPMVRYYHPDEFARLKRLALERGFVHVESGPLVRSSYHAHETADAYERAASGIPHSEFGIQNADPLPGSLEITITSK